MPSLVQYLMQSLPDAAYVTAGQYPLPAPRTFGERVVRAGVAVGAVLAVIFALLVAAAHAQVGPMPTG